MDDSEILHKIEKATYTYPVMKFFTYSHLPGKLQDISRRFAVLACAMAEEPADEETNTGLRFLLQAKDCAVRAALP